LNGILKDTYELAELEDHMNGRLEKDLPVPRLLIGKNTSSDLKHSPS